MSARARSKAFLSSVAACTLHLSDATAINFDRLAPQTQRAFIETAASIVDGFAGAADKDPGYRPQWPTPGHEHGQERR